MSGVATNDCLELDEEGGGALVYALRRCLSGPDDARAFQVLEELAGRSGCVNASDRLGRKAILELAPLAWTSRARMDALNILLSHGADINAQDANGATLLHQSLRTWNDSANHWPELLSVLLAAKANPNLTNSAGQTALHAFFGPQGFCSSHGRALSSTVGVAQKVFVMLLDAGADLGIQDQNGTTPIGELLEEDEPDFGTKELVLGLAATSLSPRLRIQSALIKHRPALLYLCDRGRADIELVERVLDLGAPVAQVERNGFSALHGAAWSYNHRLCELLLRRGANINGQDENGRTALHELVRSTYRKSPYSESDRGADLLQTADVLVEHGADARIKDKDGKTARDYWKLGTPLDDEALQLWRQLRKKLR